MKLNATTTFSVALVAAIGVSTLAAPAAFAKGGGVTSRGTCATGTWKLKAAHDSGRIQVEFEVDTNRVGQVWAVRLSDNGVLVFSGNQTTTAPSGSFTVRRLITDRAGTDAIKATATRGTTTCTGRVSA